MADTKKVIVSKVDLDAIAKIDWKNEKKAVGFFRSTGEALSSAGVFATIARATWAYGDWCKAKGKNDPDTGPMMDAFVAGRKTNGGGGVLTDTSEATYRSVAKTCASVASTIFYDGTPVIAFLSEKCGSVPFGSRAKLLSDIVAKYPKAAPSEDEMKAMRPDGADANLSDALAAVVKALEAIALDKGMEADIAKHNLADNFRDTIAKARAFATASANVVPMTPKKTRGKVISEGAKGLLS